MLYALSLFYTILPGLKNTAIGHNLKNRNTSIANTAVGTKALFNNKTGSGNTAVGNLFLATIIQLLKTINYVKDWRIFRRQHLHVSQCRDAHGWRAHGHCAYELCEFMCICMIVCVCMCVCVCVLACVRMRVYMSFVGYIYGS